MAASSFCVHFELDVRRKICFVCTRKTSDNEHSLNENMLSVFFSSIVVIFPSNTFVEFIVVIRPFLKYPGGSFYHPILNNLIH